MKNLIIVLLLGLLMFPVLDVSLAKEDDATYSWGIVSSISDGQIVVRDFDYDTYEEADITYILDADTKFVNVDGAGDIAIDDSVEIEYVTKDNMKVAKIIEVEKNLSAEEE